MADLADRPVPREMPDRLHEMIESLRQLPTPVLAVVHGPCAGAGFSLVLACDLAIASEESTFNLAYVGIGLVQSDLQRWLYLLDGQSRGLDPR